MRYEVGDCVWSFVGESLVHVMIHEIIGEHAITSDAEIAYGDVPENYFIKLKYCFEEPEQAIDSMYRRLKLLEGEEEIACDHRYPLEVQTVRMGFRFHVCGSCMKIVEEKRREQ